MGEVPFSICPLTAHQGEYLADFCGLFCLENAGLFGVSTPSLENQLRMGSSHRTLREEAPAEDPIPREGMRQAEASCQRKGDDLPGSIPQLSSIRNSAKRRSPAG